VRRLSEKVARKPDSVKKRGHRPDMSPEMAPEKSQIIDASVVLGEASDSEDGSKSRDSLVAGTAF
jgi:hypothetical protein